MSAPTDNSSCICAKLLALSTKAPAAEAVIWDPIEIPVPLLVAIPCHVGLTGPLADGAHLTRAQPISSFHGESLHALHCLFT